MNYWHMQLRPGDKAKDYPPERIRRIVSTYKKIGIGDHWDKDGNQPDHFRTWMKQGDIVGVRSGGMPIALVRVIGDCEKNFKYHNGDLWFPLVRNVEILSLEPQLVEQKYKQKKGVSCCFELTVGTLKKEKTPAFVKYWHETYLKGNKKEQIMEDTLISELAKKLRSAKNLVLTGAPGTGKTYLAWEIARKLSGNKEECIEFCQFHPSFDYSDFVEGLRPKEENGSLGFERQDGIFKDFCKRALDYSPKGRQDNFEEAWTRIVEFLSEKKFVGIPILSDKGVFHIELNNSDSGFVADRTYSPEESIDLDKLFSGYCMFFSKQQMYNVYRNLPGVNSKTHDNYRKAVIQYMKQKCGLKDFNIGDVEAGRRQPFVFIIDEINRGDISKIFGELFFSIDPGYRGDKQRVKTQYSNLISEGDVFKKGFFVPENIYIIGTMNDIDRSVESMDFAIRRRFIWEKITPMDRIAMLDGMDNAEMIKNVLKKLNEQIADPNYNLGEAYQLGAAYFLKLKELRYNFEDLWTLCIEPLLREYLRGASESVITEVIGNFKKVFDDAQTAE